MSKRVLVISALTAAIGMAGAMQAAPAQAQGMMGGSAPPMAKAAKTAHLQKCFGINAIGKNDCAMGNHSCAGQATIARDPGSFVLLPAGDCSKIAGGKLTPS